MDNYLIKEHKQKFWQVAEVFKNGVKIADVNKFYDVTTEWIIIYSTIGSTGTGWRKGGVISKIFIGNSEIRREFLE